MSDQPTAPQTIAPQQIAEAVRLIGLEFTAAECELMAEGVNKYLPAYEHLRAVPIDNSVPPALTLNVAAYAPAPKAKAIDRSIQITDSAVSQRPADLEALAFAPVTQLAHLVRTRQVTSLELTQMYLARLKKYDPILHCVVTLTEELALAQAQQADREIASGHYRGPLHGIPWGAKDLLATRGIRTTWGAAPYQEQMLDMDATVVERLTAAGAVLAAKLTMGALAYGDQWFGGQTKNPWDLSEGASGSSAGSGSATAAGLVGFSIGTETMGSITSPSNRCGITGLRPTYGRVSRHGAMALAFSMDKIGPMCRSVEDCALVFNAIYGSDGLDSTVVDRPFSWPPKRDWRRLRIGYLQQAFAADYPGKAHDEATLAVLRSLGAKLVPIELPVYPNDALWVVLWVEAAAAFDELTRSNRDDLLTKQGADDWPNIFRVARLIPGVEYLQANRVRSQMMQGMAQVMRSVDVFLQPYTWDKDLEITNYTGHPTVIVPNGRNEQGKMVGSMVFTGQLYGEAALLAVAKAYQDATEFHRVWPPL